MIHRRRALLLAPLALPTACAAPLPEVAPEGGSDWALALLAASARAHGLDGFRRLGDIAVSYDGEWPPVIGRLQPVLVDQGFRQSSEERLLPRQGIVAQAHTGPMGRKQVVRTPDGVRVRFNGAESADAEQRAAAALVADGYALFLLGPLWLAPGAWGAPRRVLAAEMGPPERVAVGGREWECDVVRLLVSPGLGFAGEDRFALFVDREEGLARRVRFTLNGLASTRGAVAEVDAWGHAERGGVRWPTRFRERLLRPFPLRVHDWWATGLDLDRGIAPPEVEGAAFLGRAAAPAAGL